MDCLAKDSLRSLFFCFVLTGIASGAAVDEVNLFRTTHGLRPFKHDPQLTAFAQMKAEYRAARMLKNGHQGPQNPPGTGEGTAEATATWGWLSCSMEEDWENAGAGVAIGGDGERYMVLVVRGGSGAARRGRSLRPVPTAHLTPDPPRFDRNGRRVINGSVRLASLASKSGPTPAGSSVRVGQRDKDGAMIISVGR